MKFNCYALCSKWGFTDGGGIFFDHFPDLEDCDQEEVLREIVFSYMLPILGKSHTFQIAEWVTHNPFRFVVLDGLEESSPDFWQHRLTPEEIEVPDEVVLEIINRHNPVWSEATFDNA